MAWLGVLALSAMFAPRPDAPRAATAEAYTINLIASGDEEVDAAIKAGSLLVALKDEPLALPVALIAHARADVAHAQMVLRALGYFDGEVRVQFDGIALEDAALPAHLDAAARPIKVVLTTTPGPRTSIGNVMVRDQQGRALSSSMPALDVPRVLALAPGAPARGSDIVAAQNRVLAALRDEGHAFARALPPDLVRDPATHLLAVELRIDPGPRVRVGRIDVEGVQTVKPAFVRARLAPIEGRVLTPAELERARRALLDLGVFAVVRARTAPLRPNGTADVTLAATERPPRLVSLRAAYATSEGGSVGAGWTHRNLFGRAERLEISGEVNRISEGGAGDLGYRLGLQFTRLDVGRLDQWVQANAAALREITDAYEKTSVGGGVMLRRLLAPKLTGGLGVSLTESRIDEGDITNNYTLLGIPVSLLWNDTEEGLDRKRGSRTEITVTPYPVARGSVDGLTTIRADAATYRDLAGDARTILALRAQFGVAFGASSTDVPADLRLYAGGSGTIRGFAFQSVGPLDSSGRPLGGTTMVAGSIEMRQRIGEQWGVVGFVDAGGVSGGTAPDWPQRIGTGVGMGVRYHTAIGPIRVDIAVPIGGKREGDADWQLYFGIGQAF